MSTATRLTKSAPSVDLSDLPDFDAEIECQMCPEFDTCEPATARCRAICPACGSDDSIDLGDECIERVRQVIAEDVIEDCDNCGAGIRISQHVRIIPF